MSAVRIILCTFFFVYLGAHGAHMYLSPVEGWVKMLAHSTHVFSALAADVQMVAPMCAAIPSV